MEMAAGGISPSELLRVTVTGRSMLPTLKPGDAILVHPGPGSTLKTGELATFLTDTGPVTHRIVARDGEDLIAKGDNARRLDPPIQAARIIGRVVAVVRGEAESPVRTGARAVWIARLSHLEGRIAGRIDPDRQASLWFRLANLPLRLLVSLIAYPGLSS
jgi:hypothetical protein